MAKMKMPTQDDILGMWQASGLKSKIIFTLLMIVVFRFGTQVSIFGVNPQVLTQMASGNNLLGFLDMFSGGALAKISVFALGIGPYITSSIIIQLLAVVIPHLETLQKEEGEEGRRKLSQYTRVSTIFLALFQSTMFLTFLVRQVPQAIVSDNTAIFFIGGIVSLTAGSVLVMWLSELITEYGIGNGGSLLIFAGIIARLPFYISQTSTLVAPDPSKQVGLVFLLAVFFATIILIIVMQEAIRKVVIVNAKRQVGNKVYGGVNTHIPFKLNPGGVMPIIFSIAILLFPATILNVLQNSKFLPESLKGFVTFMSVDILNPEKVPYYIIYFLLIVALTFFYASIMPNMQPKEIANNLKKYGSSIPGVKPGKPTADAIDKILSRVTFIGALGLGVVALIPSIASGVTGITTLQGIGSTSLIIMVGVGLDLINQIKTHLLARQYEGFLKQ